MNLRGKWIGAAAAIVLVFFFVSGNRGVWEMYKLRQERRLLTDEIARLKVETAQYQAEYQAMGRDNALLEKRAREELNLVKPGEIVYKFGSPSR
jgi:cell division protein FtsB